MPTDISKGKGAYLQVQVTGALENPRSTPETPASNVPASRKKDMGSLAGLASVEGRSFAGNMGSNAFNKLRKDPLSLLTRGNLSTQNEIKEGTEEDRRYEKLDKQYSSRSGRKKMNEPTKIMFLGMKLHKGNLKDISLACQDIHGMLSSRENLVIGLEPGFYEKLKSRLEALVNEAYDKGSPEVKALEQYRRLALASLNKLLDARNPDSRAFFKEKNLKTAERNEEEKSALDEGRLPETDLRIRNSISSSMASLVLNEEYLEASGSQTAEPPVDSMPKAPGSAILEPSQTDGVGKISEERFKELSKKHGNIFSRKKMTTPEKMDFLEFQILLNLGNKKVRNKALKEMKETNDSQVNMEDQQIGFARMHALLDKIDSESACDR